MAGKAVKKSGAPDSRTRWVILGVAAAMVVGLVLSIVLGGSDDPSSDATQVGSVEVVGDSLPPAEDPANDPAVGTKAPALKGVSFDGTPVSITPGDGRRYLVLFLAHWCPHCQAEVPRLVDWYESGAVPDDLNIVGVSTAVTSTRPNYPPSDWLEREEWPWPVLVDSGSFDAAAAYGQSGFPYFVIIDENGLVAVRFAGEIETAQLEAVLDSVFPT